MRNQWLSLIVLVLALAACGGSSGPAGPGGTPVPAGPDVSASDVAERLMTALVEEDYEQAYADLSTGRARDVADDAADLQAQIEDVGGPVTEYQLDEPLIEDEDDVNSTVFEGAATMADGSNWIVSIRMEALGTQADPWRINEFDLQQDDD